MVIKNLFIIDYKLIHQILLVINLGCSTWKQQKKSTNVKSIFFYKRTKWIFGCCLHLLLMKLLRRTKYRHFKTFYASTFSGNFKTFYDVFQLSLMLLWEILKLFPCQINSFYRNGFPNCGNIVYVMHWKKYIRIDK